MCFNCIMRVFLRLVPQIITLQLGSFCFSSLIQKFTFPNVTAELMSKWRTHIKKKCISKERKREREKVHLCFFTITNYGYSCVSVIHLTD